MDHVKARLGTKVSKDEDLYEFLLNSNWIQVHNGPLNPYPSSIATFDEWKWSYNVLRTFLTEVFFLMVSNPNITSSRKVRVCDL